MSLSHCNVVRTVMTITICFILIFSSGLVMLLIGLLNDLSMEGLIIEDYLGIQISNISWKQSLKEPLTVKSVDCFLSAYFSSISPRHLEVIYCADTAEHFDIKLLFLSQTVVWSFILFWRIEACLG